MGWVKDSLAPSGDLCVVSGPRNILDLLSFLLLKTQGRPPGLGDLKRGADFPPCFPVLPAGTFEEAWKDGKGVRLLTGPVLPLRGRGVPPWLLYGIVRLSLQAEALFVNRSETDALRGDKDFKRPFPYPTSPKAPKTADLSSLPTRALECSADKGLNIREWELLTF